MTTYTEAPPVSTESRSFLLERVQPALSGLMDGSLSTLAPIFAVVLATHHPLTAFFTGAATALGAGVSMAFSEGLSDTGDVTGRGNPVLRGLADVKEEFQVVVAVAVTMPGPGPDAQGPGPLQQGPGLEPPLLARQLGQLDPGHLQHALIRQRRRLRGVHAA